MIITLEEFKVLARPTPVERWGASAAVAHKVQEWARALIGEVVELDILDIAVMNAAANELRLGTCYDPMECWIPGWGDKPVLASVRKVQDTLGTTT